MNTITAAVVARGTKTETLVRLLGGPVSRVNREAMLAALKARALRKETR